MNLFLAGLLTLAARAAEPPAQWKDAVASAEAAMSALQQKLGARLTTELARGGPVKAIKVCRAEAETIAAEVAADRKLELGRTSSRLRSPKNAPRDWVKPYLAGAEGKKASEVDPVVVDLGDRVGVLKPIAAKGMCLQCHGRSETLPPKLRKALKKLYPEDAAVGFAEGDLRGFFWAEVPR